jgi:NhaP-type Na+/H+ or K+/H+ antiporter
MMQSQSFFIGTHCHVCVGFLFIYEPYFHTSTLSRAQNAEGDSHGIGSMFASFFSVFFGSFAIGVGVALLAALLLKHADLFRHPAIESCVVILLAYSTYLLSNATEMSGKI